MTHPDFKPAAPVNSGICGVRRTALLAMAQGLVMAIALVLVYRHRMDLPIFWQAPEPRAHHHLWEGLVLTGYAALALLAGGVGQLLYLRFAARWLMINGLIGFVVLSAIALINLLLIATTVRDLDVQLILPTALIAGLAGSSFLIARNAWMSLQPGTA